MGNFYTNFTVKSGNQARVVNTLRQARRYAYISPARDGCVVVFDRDSDLQDPDQIVRVGSLLSSEAAAPVLAVLNHDDDILCYWLFSQGQLVDAYNSCPEYFEEEEDEEELEDTEGDPRRLATLFGQPAAMDQLAEILQGDGYVFALDRHQDLLDALKLPDWSLGTGYTYIEMGDLPPGLARNQLVRLP